MIRALPWVLSGLILLAALYLFVLLLDAGDALDNARTQTTYLRERSDLALSVVRKDWIGKDMASVAQLSKELGSQGVIVGVEGDIFMIGDFSFKASDGFVVDIHYIDESQARRIR